MTKNPTYTVAALYHFADFPRYAGFKAPLEAICEEAGLKGTLLLASEGINGTVAGPRHGIDRLITFLREQPEFAALEYKLSYADDEPFLRMKVRLKKEIVTMGVPGTDPRKIVGTYVEPEGWNDLIADPDTVVIDTRNDYEVAIGTFERAVNPDTASFREFPGWARAHRDELQGRKVAMFCTGGIRCEKATAFVRDLGIEEVYHLKGGILKYLEEVPADESLWQGDCFVFDERVAVGQGLEPGDYTLCRACRHPLTPDETRSDAYVEGVSCPHCIGRLTDDDRARFAERQRQIELAKKRGQRHLGG
ncbi:rhodanese-related sulfurtransferase [Oricola cellulosilytica]|uniref:tRNA uridine(34) hydroxylase n=1 Tax=Oricola cellulosilytica TaxID=1429082 RepID=A0A4V2MNN0_9HYPH|nr:rhodanese-related sulfurtransferase [Oricola cellulosilytica]TCD13666.1 rhodanese-related sulfurtransferase [Oricola cellulosilytica]